MKKIILIVLGIILYSRFTYSQNNIVVLAGYRDIPIIYSTYYNPVMIFFGDNLCKDIELKSEELIIEKDSQCNFYVRSKPFISLATAYIYRKNILIDSFYLKVTNDIPLPNIKRSGKEMEHESNNLKFDSLICVLPFTEKYNKEVNFSIVSYIVQLVSGERIYFNEYVVGNKFSKSFKDALSEFRIGDKVVLRSVSLRSDDGYYYSISYHEFTF